MRRARRLRLCALAGMSIAAAALAGPPAAELGGVTVTATRTAASSFDVPASIDTVEGTRFNRDTLGVNLSEGLGSVPGILARDRLDYAQDQQVSIRGYGANSTFGIVGVRMFLDGIPATQPDGQGSSAHFNFASTDRIEVLRGPFSALYGNSAGGVIQVLTRDGAGPAQFSMDTVAGSYGTARGSLDASGAAGIAAYHLAYTHFQTDGYRQHSRARRESVNGKLSLDFGDNGRLSLLLNSLSAPETQDPMGLTPAAFQADPRQAVSAAFDYDTRKSIEQTQFGAIYDYKLSANQAIRLLGYYGNRQVRQFLSIPQSTQTNPLSAGGVVNLDNDYGGGDARWSYRNDVLGLPFSLVAGTNFDDLTEHRRGYENFSGGVHGVQGNLRRDEIDDVYNFDQYLQASLQFTPQWSAMVGVRHSQVKFNSADRYITAKNPDDSGHIVYVNNSPVAGILFKATNRLHLYAAYGQGFQTPTFDQLAYRADGGSGLNFGLIPEHSNNGEVGVKLRLREHTQAEAAVYRAITRNEIVVDTNVNGRSTYQNAARTRRQGVEASLTTEFAPRWQLQFAYTYLDAVIRTPYLTCTGSPCASPNTPVLLGNRLPGVPESQAFAALRWGGETGWHAALSGQYLGAVPVNDVNSVHAPEYALMGLDGGYVFDMPKWRLRTFARVDNLLGTAYVSALSVNDGNTRYFYPGSRRSALAGIGIDWKP
ncbi:MAG: TonB-dependent receptor [Nevskia sp.]|nr:TonB-dependent receptor [Nevskia sp.]